MAQPSSVTTAPLATTTTTASLVDALDPLARLSLNTLPALPSHHPAPAPAPLPPLPPLPVPSLSPSRLPAPPTAPSSSAPPPPSSSSSRPFVLFQPACADHRYARTTDIGTIVERPERLRAVKVGVAAAWARLEQEARAAGGGAAARAHKEEKDEGGAEGLDALLEGLSLGGSGSTTRPAEAEGERERERARPPPGALEVLGGPFDILSTSATMCVDDPALGVVHPVPNRAPGEAGGDDDDDEGWSTASSTPPPPPPPPADASSPPPAPPSGAARPSPSRPRTSSPTPWPTQLLSLIRLSLPALLLPPLHSEIPPHLPQGDLYLCPGSEGAIFGALAAACEAVDRVVAAAAARGREGEGEGEGARRGFVAVRPPGHHCGESSPQGFCFVNNVAVAAAHAHIKHGINRVIILDIDLHHGNGTQEIVWRINADAQRVVAEHERERAVAEKDKARASPRKSPRKGLGRAGREGGQEKEREGREEEEEEEEKARPRPLQIMYGSVHDIWSYPCEDGDPHLVAAASLTLSSGQHGQHISNVRLDPFTSEQQFHDELYPRYWDALGGRAEEFCERTRAGEGETLVIVSAGFDASEHESAGMSRHARNVPTSFYRRFARDAVLLAERCAGGKLVGVLEGGYSDWALASGVGAFLSGLVGDGGGEEGDERDAWWSEAHLKKLDKACSVVKPRRGATSTTSFSSSAAVKHTLVGASPADATSDPWLARAVDIFTRIDEHATLAPPRPPPPSRPPAPPSSSSAPRQLRERKVRHNYAGLDDGSTPIASPERAPAPARRGAPSSAAAALAPPVTFVPSVPATTMAGAAAPKVDDGPGGAAQGKPAVRFTWRQGGFGGEPRA